MVYPEVDQLTPQRGSTYPEAGGLFRGILTVGKVKKPKRFVEIPEININNTRPSVEIPEKKLNDTTRCVEITEKTLNLKEPNPSDVIKDMFHGILTVGKGKKPKRFVEIPEININNTRPSVEIPEKKLNDTTRCVEITEKTLNLKEPNPSDVIKAVKPHVPSISFHPRQEGGKVESKIPETLAPKPATPASSKPIGNTEKGSGLDCLELPSKYQRKPLSQEEMDCIEKGGPY